MKQATTYLKFMSMLVMALLISLSASATTIQQMNLSQLCTRAGQILTGKVVSITPGTVTAGGGEIPVLTYRVNVTEVFKGPVQEEKGVQFVEFTTIGSIKQSQSARNKLLLPQLKEGRHYLLMVAPEGPVGITNTIGLIQGTFEIRQGKKSMAINGVNNVGLFNGMGVTTMPNRGPVAYHELARMIHQGLAGGF